MSTLKTKDRIIQNAKEMFVTVDETSFTMRTLADRLEISQSTIYHYFVSKDKLLESVFSNSKNSLKKQRESLTNTNSLYEAIYQRVEHQFKNAIDVIFILKYYLHYRDDFKENSMGYIPKQAYQHIQEILDLHQQEISPELNIEEQSKIITHAINGFILEYYPHLPDANKRDEIINSISKFVYRSLTLRGGEMHGR